MCVRNVVLSAWTTLEMACCDALGLPEINRFKDDLKTAIQQAGKTPTDFGSWLWKRILEIRDLRNDYTHMVKRIANRFPQALVAEEAIEKIREAIHDIYGKIGKLTSGWVDLDESGGWLLLVRRLLNNSDTLSPRSPHSRYLGMSREFERH
jgi:hypothetical protein